MGRARPAVSRAQAAKAGQRIEAEQHAKQPGQQVERQPAFGSERLVGVRDHGALRLSAFGLRLSAGILGGGEPPGPRGESRESKGCHFSSRAGPSRLGGAAESILSLYACPCACCLDWQAIAAVGEAPAHSMILPPPRLGPFGGPRMPTGTVGQGVLRLCASGSGRLASSPGSAGSLFRRRRARPGTSAVPAAPAPQWAANKLR